MSISTTFISLYCFFHIFSFMRHIHSQNTFNNHQSWFGSLAGLFFSGDIFPQGREDVIWNFLHGSLCHLHGYTFRKVPLDVFEVNLCCAARYVRQLNASVVCPHLILNPVFFEDVHRLQECQSLYVLGRLKNFSDGDSQLFSRHSGKELIAVQHSPVVTFDRNEHLLEQRVRLLCNRDC